MKSLPALSPASRVQMYAAGVPFLVRATAPQARLLFLFAVTFALDFSREGFLKSFSSGQGLPG